MLNDFAKKCHENAVEKGFYEDAEQLEALGNEANIQIPKLLHDALISKRLALVHSELSESLESIRIEKRADKEASLALTNDEFVVLFKQHIKDTFEDEIADVLIRIFDLAGWLKIDLDFHVAAKMRYNSLRERKHGKEF